MVSVFLVSVLVGAILGMRFRVWVLVFAVLNAGFLAFAFGASQGEGIDTIAIAAGAIVACLVIGYVGALATRLYIATRSPQSRRAIPDNPTQPVYRPIGASTDRLH